jgi:hypothetical protein
VLYWRELAHGTRRLLSYSVTYLPSDLTNHPGHDVASHCMVLEGTNVSRVSIFEDIIVWQEVSGGDTSDPPFTVQCYHHTMKPPPNTQRLLITRKEDNLRNW